MASPAVIRAQVETRLPGALTIYARPEYEMLRTGIAALDAQTGGIPKGALTQVCAPGWSSSGKTTLLLSLLAQASRAGEYCALVDAGDCFDPVSAQAAGVQMEQLLWVRCSPAGKLRPAEQAFKAADIVIQNGGFGLIAVDLGGVEERFVRKIPLTTWFRFARVMERTPTALVFLSPFPAAHSCAALTLQLNFSEGCWKNRKTIPHAQLLTGIEFHAEITRARMRKPVQPAHPRFTATPQWG